MAIISHRTSRTDVFCSFIPQAPEKEVKHEGVYTAEQMKIVSEAVALLFASSPSKIKREREALEQIKERQEERKEEKASVASEQQSKDKVVNALENKLDKMIAKLDKEMNKIDSRASALMSIVDTNHDGTFPIKNPDSDPYPFCPQATSPLKSSSLLYLI